MRRLLFGVAAFFSLTASAWAADKLVFAVDLIRHGDRTPIHEIPASPHPWKEGLGELTQVGAQQERALGHAMRQFYVDETHLLPARYETNTIYIRSTEIPRAIKSAEAFLQGLYPASTRPTTDFNIPIDVIAKDKDTVLLVKTADKAYKANRSKEQELVAWQSKTMNLKPQLARWAKLTGYELNDFQSVEQLGNALFIRQLHHVKLPPGITAQDVKQINALGTYGMSLKFKEHWVSYPAGQAIVNLIAQHMKEVMQQQSHLKYILLSAHDSTIMSLMSTIGLPLDKVPPYASHVNFTLWQSGERYYLKISYNNRQLNVPSCTQDKCSIEQFSAIANQPI